MHLVLTCSTIYAVLILLYHLISETSSTQKQTTPVWPSRTTTTDTKLTEEVQTAAGNSGHSTKTGHSA